MSFRMIHENYNVSDLDRSIKFYGDALDLHEVRRKTTDDFIIVYLSNDSSDFELELTWLKEHPQPYDWGNVNSIWHLKQMILIRRIKSTKKWVVSALKTLKWVSISSRTRTAIGSKFCRNTE